MHHLKTLHPGDQDWVLDQIEMNIICGILVKDTTDDADVMEFNCRAVEDGRRVAHSFLSLRHFFFGAVLPRHYPPLVARFGVMRRA